MKAEGRFCFKNESKKIRFSFSLYALGLSVRAHGISRACCECWKDAALSLPTRGCSWRITEDFSSVSAGARLLQSSPTLTQCKQIPTAFQHMATSLPFPLSLFHLYHCDGSASRRLKKSGVCSLNAVGDCRSESDLHALCGCCMAS